MATISNLEKEIFRSIGDHSIPTDLVLKNRQLFRKVKKCRVKILRLPKGKLTTKKRFNLGRIVTKKAEKSKVNRAERKSRQENKNNGIATQIEQENLNSQSTSKIRSTRKASSLPFEVKVSSIEKDKSFNNSKRKNNKDINNEKIKLTKEQEKLSSEVHTENGSSKPKRKRNSLEEVQKLNTSQGDLNSTPDSKTRKRSTNVDAKDNIKSKVQDNKSSRMTKSKRHSNSISNGIDKSKIFIKLSQQNQLQAKIEKYPLLSETQKPDNSSKNIKLLNRTYMIKKFGIRFFNSYVKVKREYLDKAALPTIKEIIRTKRNNKSVSFSETVEVFGESDTAEESEPEKETLEDESNIELQCNKEENTQNEESNQDTSPMEVIDVDRFCTLKVIDTLSPNSRARKSSNDSEILKHQNDKESEKEVVEKKWDNIQEAEKEDSEPILKNDLLEKIQTPDEDKHLTTEKADSDSLEMNNSKSSEQSEYKTPEKEIVPLEKAVPKEDEIIALDKEASEADSESNTIEDIITTRKFDSPIPGRPPIRRLTKNKVLDSDSESDSDNSHPATSEAKKDPIIPINIDINPVVIGSDDSDTSLSAPKSIAEETDSVLLFDKLKRGDFGPDENLPPQNLISSLFTNTSYTGMTENLLLTDDILDGTIEKVQPQADHEEMDVFVDAEGEKISDALKEGSGNEFLTSLSLLDNEPAKSSFDIDQ